MFAPGQKLNAVKLAMKLGKIRTKCWLMLSSNDIVGSPVDCIIDTGAQFTVIPQRHWEPFRAEIPGIALPPDTSIEGIGGRIIPARFGSADFVIITLDTQVKEIRFEKCRVKFAFDRDAKRDSQRLILTRVSELWQRLRRRASSGRLPKGVIKELPFMIVGLEGGVLQKGGLCINGRTNEAHLIELL